LESWRKPAFLVLLALQLGLVWTFPRYATQDGPSHLYNAGIIAGLHSGMWPGLSEFFRINPKLVPNWTTYFLLIQFMKVCSAAVAGKILVSIYIVLFALSFWWVAEVVRPGSDEFRIWGLVLAGNWFLSMGFYNFCYGLVLFLLCFGYWFKWRKSFAIRQCLVLLVLTSLLYLTHFFCFLMAAFLIVVTGTAICLGEARQGERSGGASRNFAKLFLRSVFLPELCFLVFLLLKPFTAVGSQHVAHTAVLPTLWVIEHRLLFRHGASVFYLLLDRAGTLAKVSILITATFMVAALYWTLRRAKETISGLSMGLAIFSLVCFAFYLFGVDDYSGTGMLRERTEWFGLLGLFAFLASRGWNAAGKRWISVAAVMVCATNLLSGAIWRRQVSPLLRSFDEAAQLVEPGKTILDKCYCHGSNARFALLDQITVNPFAHAGDITALSGRDIAVANYEALGTSFPVEYLPEVNPDLHAPELEDQDKPDIANIADYEEKTGKSVDYVLIWGEPETAAVNLPDSPLWEQLRGHYVLVYGASGISSLQLFRKIPKGGSSPEKSGWMDSKGES